MIPSLAQRGKAASGGWDGGCVVLQQEGRWCAAVYAPIPRGFATPSPATRGKVFGYAAVGEQPLCALIPPMIEPWAIMCDAFGSWWDDVLVGAHPCPWIPHGLVCVMPRSGLE